MNIRTIYHTGTILTLMVFILQDIEPSLARAEGTGTSRRIQSLDIATIERLTDVKGKLDEKEGVFKVSGPRTDLQVTTAGVRMTPPMGLTSWAAFMKTGDQTLVMGGHRPARRAGESSHEHGAGQRLGSHRPAQPFFWDSPKVMFMHIGGKGDEERLATAVGKVFAKTKETSGGKAAVPLAPINPAKTSLDPREIEDLIGAKGERAGGIFKITLGRTTKVEGHTVGSTMGVNTWAAFAGSDEQAVVDGDFVVYEDELQPVLKALRRAGIHIVAIHSHMTTESPRTVFLHYWGVGPTSDLARALKSALDIQRRNP